MHLSLIKKGDKELNKERTKIMKPSNRTVRKYLLTTYILVL